VCGLRYEKGKTQGFDVHSVRGDTDTAPHILNVSTGMCVPPRSLVHSYQLPSVAELPAVNAVLLTPTK
jgi:hypothetical protein